MTVIPGAGEARAADSLTEAPENLRKIAHDLFLRDCKADPESPGSAVRELVDGMSLS